MSVPRSQSRTEKGGTDPKGTEVPHDDGGEGGELARLRDGGGGGEEEELTRGVILPGLESIPESDFEHLSEFDDYDYNSNSSKNRFLYCTEAGFLKTQRSYK